MIPFNSINKDIAAVATLIPPQKIQLGITSIGYIYELPYTVGESGVQFISYPNAIQLAIDTNSVIQFDANTQGSYFFINVNNKEYFIWFREARGIDSFVKLVPQYGLHGIAIWNIMYYLAQMMIVINSQYEIEKVL
jgi:spore germination protein